MGYCSNARCIYQLQYEVRNVKCVLSTVPYKLLIVNVNGPSNIYGWTTDSI